MQVRGGQPPFVSTVTKETAGRLSKNQHAITQPNSTYREEEAVEQAYVGRIELQEILDEVASIEHLYGRDVLEANTKDGYQRRHTEEDA